MESRNKINKRGKTLTSLLSRYATLKHLALLFALLIIINMLFALFFADLEHGVPDTHIHYTAEEFYTLMEGYTSEERVVYIRGLLLLDFLYPIIYSLFLSLLIFRLSHRTTISLLPFGVLMFDFFENITLLILVVHIPERFPVTASIAGYFTLIKWSLAALCAVTVLILIVRRVLRAGRQNP